MAGEPSGRRIAVTGASGLIGSALVSALRERGDEVLSLVRRPPATASERRWEPRPGGLDPRILEDVDAVVHLAGAGVGDKRWTPAYKRLVLSSRVDGTTAVAQAIAATGKPIRLVNGSAIGYYGDRGDELLDEQSAPGTGFLAEVVRAWEGAAEPASAAGAPVAFARTGLVMAQQGGAFERLLTLTRFGLGGPLGAGRQWWAWITLPDEVAALVHLIDRPELVGPVNLVGPDPRRQQAVAVAIARQLHRPALVPAPAIALRVVVGEFADDILGSQRVLPAALLASGFVHQHAVLDHAVEWLTARRRRSASLPPRG